MALDLGVLGLDAETADVYREMLKDSTAVVPELAERLDRSDDQIRKAIDELDRLGLVRQSWQNPRVLRAVEPEYGLLYLLTQREKELRRRHDELETGRLAVQNLVAEYTQYNRARHKPPVEVLTGLDTIRLRIQTLAANCTSEILSLVPGGALSAAALQASSPLDQELLDHGVQMRTVYLESIANDVPTLEYARWLTDLGAQIRVAPTQPVRMTVYDRRIAMIPVDPDATGSGALLLRSPGVVGALCSLFEQVWADSVPLGRQPKPNEHGLTSQEQAVLALLSKGLADEAVARRLGVSVRTGRRITANLMGRLEADSRFQAGVMAALHGWISPDMLV
ncbi:LuxR C-terminal-related transcriptional regulator [Streptomyces sp. NBC_00988]|uniref:helix-turn-helix domain-containing protein n=1 Tax=Streptomyces sp. NBC_00988 TaxID=2903704 RepID=UPI00386E6B26|nr:LuxR C-terminal-related transcriptional regulator [Streptomyces sp. NBC_00988]